VVLSGCQGGLSEWAFARTGEERVTGQLRGLFQLATDVLHPSPRTAPEVPVAHAGVNPFGINVFLEQEVEAWKRERSVAMVAEAGFHWLRQEFPWEDIEIHGKGDFQDRRHEPYRSAWEKYDHIVDLAGQYGLELIVRLSNPPAWTRVDSDALGTYAPPDRLADWGDYVHTIVSRYRGRVHYYQLWNEPNIYPEWGEQPVDPEAYTEFLCEGYRRAKEADPDAVVLSGALAPTVSLHPGPGPALGLNEFVFLQRMYDAGAAECFDILAANDYLLWSGPTDHRMEPLNINFSRPVYLRDMMVANGDAHKSIWISEMNSNAVPDDPSIQGWGGYGQVTLEQQARYAVLAYERAMTDWPWMGVVNFWFFKRASDAERDQAWYYFRMVEPDFTPLPVYDAMRDFTSELVPALYPGVHLADHWALAYQSAEGDGDWVGGDSANESDGSRRSTSAPGASLSLIYEGAGLQLATGTTSGVVQVSVDGGQPRRVVLDGQPTWLVRRSVLDFPGAWRDQRHRVTVRLVEGELAVRHLVVLPAWDLTDYLLPGALGLALALGWLVARLLRRRRPVCLQSRP
jgi:hypothetical protein